jgi:hypothetical protein
VANYQLDLDQNALQQLGMSTAKTLVTRVTRRTLNRSTVLVPVDNGPLRAHGQMRVGSFGNQVRGEVEYDIEYALMVHDGTSPHVIRPKRARSRRNPRRPAMLRFEVGGQVVYARQVNHPGTKPRPYLSTALREVAEPEGFLVTIG